MAIHLVTDSTSDLSPALLEEAGVETPVHIVPLTVHFGDEEYKDGVDLHTDAFYPKLTASGVMPRTSQPSPAAFVEVYESISQPGDVILSYHVSSRLSGTHQSASLAARQVEGREIEVIDTRSASLGLGLVVLDAARRIAAGEDKDSILNRSREIIASLKTLFLVDTLEYLQRNGRIGKAQAFVGGLLNVKPILTIEDGVVAPVEKTWGRAKARRRLIQLVEESSAGQKLETGAVLHAASAAEADSVSEELATLLPGVRFYVGQLGPTIGTHAGPGTLGVVTIAK